MFDPEIEVRRLRLMPGDVVIVTIPAGTPEVLARAMTGQIQGALAEAGHAETPVALALAGTEVSVMGPNEPGAMTTTGGGAPR